MTIGNVSRVTNFDSVSIEDGWSGILGSDRRHRQRLPSRKPAFSLIPSVFDQLSSEALSTWLASGTTSSNNSRVGCWAVNILMQPTVLNLASHRTTSFCKIQSIKRHMAYQHTTLLTMFVLGRPVIVACLFRQSRNSLISHLCYFLFMCNVLDVFTARCSYASAVLDDVIVILSVYLSLRLSRRALWRN